MIAETRNNNNITTTRPLLLIIIIIALLSPHTINSHEQQRHTLPTLLSTKDANSGQFVNVQNNDLYTDLHSNTVFYDSSIFDYQNEQFELIVNKGEVGYGDSLQLYVGPRSLITSTLRRRRRRLLHNTDDIIMKDDVHVVTMDDWLDMSDVVAMYCDEDEHRFFRDAATVEQLLLHHAYDANHEDSDDSGKFLIWNMPSFPVVRATKCHFKLWSYTSSTTTNDDKFTTGTTSTITTTLNDTSTVQQLLANVNNSNSKQQHKYLKSRSNEFILRDSNIPQFVHLALTNKISEMRVHFTTFLKSGKPVVIYGTSQDKLDQKRVGGNSTTYLASDMCEAPANMTAPGFYADPGIMHEVVMTDLVPDTLYHYRVGLSTGQGIIFRQDIYNFTSAPDDTTDDIIDYSFSFIAFGDQGCPETGWTIGANMTASMIERELHSSANKKKNLRAVHHFGDLSYGRGSVHIWDGWFQMNESLNPYIPLMIGVGNHEYDYVYGGEGKDPSGAIGGFHPTWGNFLHDSNGECGVATAKRFTMPSSENSNGIFWYSYNFANTHVIMLSSEHNLTKSSPQYDFLESDLQKVNRTKTPWVIVESHRPPYQSEDYPDQNAVGIGMRAEIEDLMFDYNVDLYLAGHYHSYLRTCPGLYKSKCHNKNGALYAVIGSAGARMDNGTLYKQSWTEFFIKTFGYGRVTVKNSTALHFEFVESSNGSVLDEVWLHK